MFNNRKCDECKKCNEFYKAGWVKYVLCIHIYIFTLKKVYDRNIVNKYRLYLLLDIIIFYLIDYIYICVCVRIYYVSSTLSVKASVLYQEFFFAMSI